MQSDAMKKDPSMGPSEYARIPDELYQTTPDNIDCIATLLDFNDEVIWECACGDGNISKRLYEITGNVPISSDLRDRGFGVGNVNFLNDDYTLTDHYGIDQPTMIFTNPPYEKRKGEKYSLAEQFVRKALTLMKPVNGKVIMFMRTEFDTAKNRKPIFEDHPAYKMKLIVTKRPRWIVGSTGSPRHSYSFYVWDWSHDGSPAQVRYLHPDDADPIMGAGQPSLPST